VCAQKGPERALLPMQCNATQGNAIKFNAVQYFSMQFNPFSMRFNAFSILFNANLFKNMKVRNKLTLTVPCLLRLESKKPTILGMGAHTNQPFDLHVMASWFRLGQRYFKIMVPNGARSSRQWTSRNPCTCTFDRPWISLARQNLCTIASQDKRIPYPHSFIQFYSIETKGNHRPSC